MSMFMRLVSCRLQRGLAVGCVLLGVVLCLSGGLGVLSAEETEGKGAEFLLEWGERGSGEGEFDFPIGIVLTGSGELLVGDFYNSRIQRFNSEGKYLGEFAVLPNPGGMVLDGDENLYIGHFSAMRRDEEPKPSRISMYDREGKFVRSWGKTGSGEGEFDYPGGLAISKDQKLYVADQTNHRVQVFDLQGKFLFKWGSYGVKEGEFGGNTNVKSRVGGPQFIAIDREGMIYTTEGTVCRIQKFSPAGEFISAWGDTEDRPGGVGGLFPGTKGGILGPIAICLDGEEHLWITTTSGRVQEFTREGKFLRMLGEGGSEPGQFLAPHMLVSDGKGVLYVADSYNHRIQKFRISRGE